MILMVLVIRFIWLIGFSPQKNDIKIEFLLCVCLCAEEKSGYFLLKRVLGQKDLC